MNAYDSLMSKSCSTKKRRRRYNNNNNNNSANNAATTASSLLSNNDCGGSRFFLCPAGCGVHVSETTVNAHLDSGCPQLMLNDGNNCSGSNYERDNKKSAEEGKEEHNDDAANNEIKEFAEEETNHTTTTTTTNNNLNSPAAAISDNNNAAMPQSTVAKAKQLKKCTQNYSTTTNNNAFQHMMKKSAQVYSNNGNNIMIQQRFHLYNDDQTGIVVSWTCEDDYKEADGDDTSIPDSDNNIQWSATIILKKVKAINMYEHGEQQQQQQPVQERSIQLTVSSSIPPYFFSALQSPQNTTKPKLPRLVQRHSNLSISHLKSCLQKSIRRRAPLPAVRVAMELADKSWTDLIRRLPIIILEDSTLHPDFALLVWLMIADSKGYVPSKMVIVRVLQIVFEMASCPWQDEIVAAKHSNEDCSSGSVSDNDDNKKTTSFSLSSSSSTLFPMHQQQQHKEQTSSTNVCETMIRAMLLRAQYGGMRCDVDMLHSFSKIWLQRFNGAHAIPSIIASNCTPGPTSSELNWSCIPYLIHAKARQQSETLVTMSMVNSPGRVVALTANDVCPAGIDFHCSQVVDHLLSRPNVYGCLCERLKTVLPPKSEMNRDWIASKVKECIWNYSSGVNRRRSLMGSTKQNECASVMKSIWDDALSSPFDDYVKKFVKDRLH